MFCAILLGTLLAVLSQAQTAKQLPPAASLQVDFTTHIQPILKTRCYTCHGEQLQLRKLRLDRRADAIRGGESGIPAIVPGDSANSLLIRYVAGLDPDLVMPPEGDKLTPDDIGLLRAWIDQGAAYPGDAAELSSESDRPASDHWAFQPVRRPSVPAVRSKLGSATRSTPSFWRNLNSAAGGRRTQRSRAPCCAGSTSI